MLLLAWTLALIVTRLCVSGSPRYQWLFWDIFLALVPLLFARLRWFWPWLAFLPNAPYLMTEIMHFRHEGGVPYWLDLAMLVSLALLGLRIGFETANTMLPRKWHPLLWLAVGYGIYLGRVVRLNSWDLVLQPLAVLRPMLQPNVWLFTLVFAFTLTAISPRAMPTQRARS